MLDNVGSDTHEPTSLEGIALTASLNKEHRFQNLYGELKPELLLSAWMRINKDAASGVEKMTAADDQKNLLSNIEDFAQRLKEKTYKAKLVRRTYIPKDNGKERP
jgi:retron-type reverse transcriptase